MNDNLSIYRSAGQNTGWIRFIGILNIIYGVFTILTCIGILYGWVFIWAGVLLTKAANAGEQAGLSQSETALIEYHQNLQKFFKMISIAIIVTFVVTIGIIVIAMMSGFLAGVLGSLRQY